MISKRIATRKDGGSSARKSLRYGEGLKRDRDSGLMKSKSLRTYFSGFGVVDDGICTGKTCEEMVGLIELAAKEMQANCDLNTRVSPDKKIAHFIVSFDQYQPTEAVLRDTEISMLSALKLLDNHWASFLHNDNGHWHLHIFASRIDQKTHKGNDLWQDKTIRDRTVKEIEKRHGLKIDNGMHEFDERGQLIKLSPQERESRKGKKSISDQAASAELHADAQSFQSWVFQIQIGDRLKHAKTWKELHDTAAAYGCEIKQKGAGFIICPTGEKGGIQLSKVGLKSLTARYGEFQPAQPSQVAEVVSQYHATPTDQNAQSHYQKWRVAKQEFQPLKAEQIKFLRENHKAVRASLREAQKNELNHLRSFAKAENKFAAVSVAKMNHVVQMQALSEQLRKERQALYQTFADKGPGNTFKDYLQKEAVKGDNRALGLLRKSGHEAASELFRNREANKLSTHAVVTGQEYRQAHRLKFAHRIEQSGSVVYFLGQGRQITDSAISRQVLLNAQAALNQDAIATALRFSMLKFGSNLTLTGSQEFQKLAVETAVKERLLIQFNDPVLEAYRQKLLTKSLPTHIHNKEYRHASHHYLKQLDQKPPAHLTSRLHDLSAGDLVYDPDRNIGLLWPDVHHNLEQPKEKTNRPVQRSAGRAEGTGLAGHPKPAGLNADADKRTAGKQIPVTQTMGLQPLSAQEWAEKWSRTHHKKIAAASQGGNGVSYAALHVAADGVVLDMGQTIAIYPPSNEQIEVGAKVEINAGQVFLQQKSIRKGLER